MSRPVAVLSAALLVLTLVPATTATAQAVTIPSGAAAHVAAAKPTPTPSRASQAQTASRSRVNRFRDSGAAVWLRTPLWVRQVGYCIRKHESIRAGHYRAHNPRSSAAGAYQMLRGTYKALAKRAGVPFRGSAAYATPAEQDRIFIYAATHGGLRNWHGTNCPGT